MPVHSCNTGALAYWDTHTGGLVKVRILAAPRKVENPESHTVSIEVLATGNRIYRRGEVHHDVPLRDVLPRAAVHKNPGSTFPTIFSYHWEF